MKKHTHYAHLDEHARDRLEALLESGHTQKEAAKVLKVDPSTVSREVRRHRNRNGGYDAADAQRKTRNRRKLASHKGRKIEAHPELRKRIIEELQAHRSPDEIAGRMRREKLKPRVGKDAIYAWLYSAWGGRYLKHLCTKRHRKRPQRNRPRREMIPNRKPLSKRPATRGLVHGQGDTFVSPKRSHTTVSGFLVCEEESNFLAGELVPDLKPATTTGAVERVSGIIALDDLTMDNGIENKHHEAWSVPAYFCDPHAPWQKARIESAIGLVRRWFLKKGTDLSAVTDEAFQTYLAILNGKYRKSLGYRSAYEVAVERGIIRKRIENSS
jgi:transposase, IS30 family